MSVLAIDQGTTSTRSTRVDEHGSMSIVHVVEHAQHYPKSGWVEHDPEELIANVRACTDGADDVTAIGIDNQGESCLAWNADTGEAVSPVIVWQDHRTRDVIDRLKSDGVERMVMEASGLPLDCYFSASKLAWIVATVPEAKRLHARGKLRLGTTDAFFLDRLTGTFATDVTTASRTSLMNLRTLDWDRSLCELFGVPIEALPPIVPTTGELGVVESRHGGIPITASVVDQQAALYGHGCRDAGDAKVTFGTGAFALAVTAGEAHRAPDRGLLPTVAWHLAGETPVYALDGGVYCAGSAVNWTRSLGLFQTFDEIDAFDAAPAIERDLAFVPALAGLGCPHWDRDAVGVWIGMSLDTTRGDLMQAVLEGVALRATEVLDAMSDHVAISNAISIDGGMSVNPYFCQFLANASSREVTVPALGEITALGTALLAAQGAGAAIERDDMPGRTYFPRGDWSMARSRFEEAIRRSRDWGG